MWNKDEREGKVEQAKGRVKQAVGDLTNNAHLKTEGQVDEAKGQIKEAVGHVRREAGKTIDEIVKAVKH
jgi:uncharacterized protein YjbJ (UPF0337 family)